MPGSYTNIDLSQLPVPDVVEQIDFETILAELLADYQARCAARGVVYTALLESDPAYIALEAGAYRETLVRQRANESAKAVMLAFAQKGDLDNIGANYEVERLTLIPADPTTVPPTAAVMESDADYRYRIQLSFEGYTTAGSDGSYVYHAMSADADVKDVSPLSPQPGYVDVYVLSRTGNGTAPQELLDNVNAALSAEDVRPLTDFVSVLSAEIVEFDVQAELTLYPGPDADVVRQSALDALSAYCNGTARIGYDVTLAGIYASLMRPGVQNVTLTSPIGDIVIDDTQAPYCASVNLTVASQTNV